jgi:hypothetical protein
LKPNCTGWCPRWTPPCLSYRRGPCHWCLRGTCPSGHNVLPIRREDTVPIKIASQRAPQRPCRARFMVRIQQLAKFGKCRIIEWY